MHVYCLIVENKGWNTTELSQHNTRFLEASWFVDAQFYVVSGVTKDRMFLALIFLKYLAMLG